MLLKLANQIKLNFIIKIIVLKTIENSKKVFTKTQKTHKENKKELEI